MAVRWLGSVAVAVAVALSASVAGCSGQEAAPVLDVSASASAQRPAADGKLLVGTLAPQTGPLAFLGPAQAAGVRLALQDVNAAGGVLGAPVELVEGDAGAVGADTLRRSWARELALGVDAVVGPPSSLQVQELVAVSSAAGVLMVSPSASAAGLSSLPSGGLFARTVAPDTAQARVLAELVADAGHTKVCVVAPEDDYGKVMSSAVVAALPQGASAQVVGYAPAGTDFAAAGAGCAAMAPDAVVLVGVESSPAVVAALTAAGVGPGAVPLFVTDGAVSAALGEGLAPDAAARVKGVVPGAAVDEAFVKELTAVEPGLVSTDFAAEAYDAFVLVALAATAAGSDEGPAMAAALPKLSSPDPGAVCDTFAACADRLSRGEPVNYSGRSGPVDITASGDPAAAPVGVYVFEPSGPRRTGTVVAEVK